VKALARKKKEEASGGNAPWLNTFADLMNLLLCFFVLLFAMSDVDSVKFENLSVSLANSFGVLEGGGTAIGSGALISSGMTQLTDLSEYYTSMGMSSKKNGNEIDQKGNKENSSGDSSKTENEKTDIKDAMDKMTEAMKEVSTGMYDNVSNLSQKYNLGDYVELSIDPEYQYVELTLKGSILFDSGKAELKEEAKPILSKIGQVLKKFDGYTIEITGHTDNVPMVNSTAYKDNNWLSSARALYTAEYLIQNSKLDPTRLKYSGRGEYEPINSNATADGRAKNRRIEIKIYNEYSGK
jgi:chemotaxis protein MotB